MTKFVRIETVQMQKIAFCEQAPLEYNDGSDPHSYSDASSWIVRSNRKEELVLNADEIAMLKLSTFKALDPSKASVDDEGRLIVKNAHPFYKYTVDKGHLGDFQNDVECGVLVLKREICMNLGPNSVDVGQTLYITKESYDRLMKELF